jgi:SapC
MTELKELNNNEHSNLKVSKGCILTYASQSHILSLRATEVGHAATSLPVFMTKNQHTGNWNISAVTSVQPGNNLFVENDQWTATYQPTCMQTYPFYLMNSPKKENSYTVGIDINSTDFSVEEGQPLFEADGKATAYLSKVTSLLEADIKNDIQTHQFLEVIDKIGLIKPIDLLIQYRDGTANTIQGLHTINEEVLHALTAEQLLELNSKGYFTPIHAMLISLLQINLLVKKNNADSSLNDIQQVKIETSKNQTAF